MLPHLDERQRRLVLGAEARALGHGGIKRSRGPPGRRGDGLAGWRSSRRAEPWGGAPAGRRPQAGDRADPGLLPALLALVEPESRGDPESPLRWTTKSTRRLAEELAAAGHKVSAGHGGQLLREGFSLQAQRQDDRGRPAPGPGRPVPLPQRPGPAHLAAGDPVISVDTKKKELVGEYKNGGREWHPAGEPEQVNVHDFIDPRTGQGEPVRGLRRGRRHRLGQRRHRPRHRRVRRRHHPPLVDTIGPAGYPHASRLLITADGGGSNGYRTRLWKTELAGLAAETGLTITVCHLPPGTRKWNKIEHRLFSHISMNWRGRPLTSHEVIVKTIAATTTSTGLTVHAELDTSNYPTGIKITDKQMNALHETTP